MMDYKITVETEDTETYGLAMLQQHDEKSIPISDTLSRNLTSFGSVLLLAAFVLFPVDIPPKPYFVWTFDEDTGGWVNDISNWHQKWQPIDGAICLCNVPDEPKKYTKILPWLALGAKKEEKLSQSAKAPLWSPPISQAVGMRCITMDYILSVGLVGFTQCSLAMLHKQDG
ncbi:hypothetical protein TcWFU_006866 [Taenia crassiceps]|uniref:Uncharacterized protein n=1 Tax=Taenia crassiceps TaxID=6207 RepID=A0ABR4QIA7_9CEST